TTCKHQPSIPTSKAIRCWKSPTKPKNISLCYKAWENTIPTTTSYCKTLWETDCAIQLTNDEW
ncbi:Hypothetical predicted protein, partial [Pelobates cultripes]